MDAARAAGADGVEVDVRPSLDDCVMVFHDRTLSRLAGRRESIRRLTRDQLRSVRIRGESIPTLDEVLEATRGLLINIELKDDSPLGNIRFARHVVEQIRDHRAERRVLVSSFNLAAVARFRTLAPDLPSGVLIDAKTRVRALRTLASVVRRVIRPFAINPEASLMDARRLKRWHASGYVVIAWTVNDRDVALRLAHLGVDGLITDDPEALRTWLAEGT